MKREYIITLSNGTATAKIKAVGTSIREVLTGILKQQNAPFKNVKSVRMSPLNKTS